MKILLVDDDPLICNQLSRVLKKQGFKVTIRFAIEAALKENLIEENDLLILDLVFIGKGGKHLVKELHKRKQFIPIIILSALSDVDVKVDLLKTGVDDYITKPCNPQELTARIRAVYRRYLERVTIKVQDFGDLQFFRKQNKVVREGQEITLTNKESALLNFLLQRKNEIVTNKDILATIWQTHGGFHSNIVQSTVRRLRKKLDQGFTKKLIHNIHGVGYKICISK